MIVKELIQKLQEVDENLEVFIIQTNDEFKSSLVDKAEVRNVLFTENPEDDENSELACRDDVFVITDEI